MSIEDLFFLVAGFMVGGLVVILIELFIIWSLDIEYLLTAKCYFQHSSHLNTTTLAKLLAE